MKQTIKIAVDAMGGEKSPAKVLKGIKIHKDKSNDVFYNIFGDKDLIEPIIKKIKLDDNFYKVFHT